MGGFSVTPTVRNLLFINIGIFLVEQLSGLNLAKFLGYHYIHANDFAVYQCFTYMFVHSDLGHLFSNMFALFIFGPMMEQVLGDRRFLILYIVTGLGGGALYALVDFFEMYRMEAATQAFIADPQPQAFLNYINDFLGGRDLLLMDQKLFKFANESFPEHPDSPAYINEAVGYVKEAYSFYANIPMVGASGAVFGILFGFAYLFPNAKLMLIIPPIPMKAKVLVGLYSAYEIYMLWNASPTDNVAHLAHIGGMLFAFILFKKWGMKAIH